jgi:hypothetical protein
MNLVRINNIATTIQGFQVNLVLNELYIGTQQPIITTPWLLEIVDQDNNVIKTELVTGNDTGEDFNNWYNSEAGQAIRTLLAQQASLLLNNPESNLSKTLGFFATLNN